MRRRHALVALAAVAIQLGCRAQTPSVVGRWERIGVRRPGSEWVEFADDGTFTAAVLADTMHGTYTQRGRTVTATVNYTRRLTLRGTTLVMEDGTKYRRVH